jgi:GT2 family glycosyltransferase
LSGATGVVIATRNRRESLLPTLGELRALPERPPVVVVDNDSTDGTADAVRRLHPEVTVIQAGRNAGAAGRTLGARALETPLVAFSDDDSWWAPGSLARAARLFGRHPRLGLIAARILVGAEQRLDPTSATMLRTPLPPDPGLPGLPVLGFVACGAVVRRSAFLAMGGFEERLGVGGEEELLALDLAAAGWGLAYVDDVVAHHHPARAGPDRRGRDATVLRNLIWVTWLRRPPARAVLRTLALGVRGVRERAPQALLHASRGLPWALRERRPLPPRVERAARMLERASGPL